MTKSINYLINDIYALLKKKDWFNNDLARDFSSDVGVRLQQQLGVRQGTHTLRLSRMGPQCARALYCSVRTPELAEPLPPWAEIKYSFGHILEALAITLAKAAGHNVTGEQDELTLDGIVGHRDCVIDGCVVDVKSASTISFNKFRSGKFGDQDTFGYLDQLDGYVIASRNDVLVTNKEKGYLLVIDKQLGHMCLYPHEVTNERERILRDRIQAYKAIVGLGTPPPCSCGTIADGASGNVRLDLRASYSPFKHSCFPGLRTFLYAGGPVFLTKVLKRPFNKDGPIKEVDSEGKIVYN